MTSITDQLATIMSNTADIADGITVSGALTDRSGTIASGGTAQQAMAANTSRRYLFFQNNSTGTLWVRLGAAAVQDQPSWQLPPRAVLVMEDGFVSTEALSVIGATTGQQYSAAEA